MHSPATGEARAREKVGCKATVLVVEDDAAVAELVVDLLDGSGYQVQVAANADAALDILRRGDDIDLVFSDIVMPGDMNGLDLARTVRDEFPSVFVLLATGYAAAASKAAAEFPLLNKPYGREQLSEQINKILGIER